MKSDPASEFLAKFIEDNADVIDPNVIDPETGLPRMRLPAGNYVSDDE